MANSFVGSATGTTSATLPAHQANDLIVGFAFRDGSTTLPTVPAGWTTQDSGAANANCLVLVSKIAASSGETTGTFTNATSVNFHVYRGIDLTTPIGAKAQGVSTTTSHTFPGLTLQVTDGTSWVGAFIGSRAIDSAIETPPTGMTNRSTTLDATDETAGHDTNGGVSSWSSVGITQGGTTTGSRSVVYEIRAASTGISGDLAGSISFTGASDGTVLVQGASDVSIDFPASATGQILASGAASSTFALDGTATGTIGSTSISGAADVTLDFSLSATGVGPIIIRSADPDAPSWKQLFYDKQLKEFEDSLDEIVSADDPQEAAQEAVEAFQPLETPSPIIRDNLQAISEALRGMTMRSLRRKELQAEIADIRAELARVAEYRRKRRNNEAALLLLL